MIIDREFKNPLPPCLDSEDYAQIGETYGEGAVDAATLAGNRDLCLESVRKWRDIELEARGLTQ